MDITLADLLGIGNQDQSKTPALSSQTSGSPMGSFNLFGLGSNNLLGSTGLGFNVGTGQLALGGLSALGNLWTAWNATDLAKKQFDFQKQFSMTNLMNQTKAYNTALADRARSRAATENRPQSEADAYVAANRI